MDCSICKNGPDVCACTHTLNNQVMVWFCPYTLETQGLLCVTLESRLVCKLWKHHTYLMIGGFANNLPAAVVDSWGLRAVQWQSYVMCGMSQPTEAYSMRSCAVQTAMGSSLSEHGAQIKHKLITAALIPRFYAFKHWWCLKYWDRHVVV